MADTEDSFWLDRPGAYDGEPIKGLPFSSRLATSLRKEAGPNVSHRVDAFTAASNQLWDETSSKYGKNNQTWPAAVRENYFKTLGSLRSMFVSPQEDKMMSSILDVEEQDPADRRAEEYLRAQYPEETARMETSEAYPTPTPMPPVAAPVKKAPPIQKPLHPKMPKEPPIGSRAPTAFEKAVMAQRDKWEKEGLFTPPSMQEIARERLAVLKRPEEAAIPLPEETNPTGAR